MALGLLVRKALLGLAVMMIVSCALAQQSGQNGSSTSGSTAAPSQVNKGTDAQSRYQRQPLLYISGTVAADDGSPLPVGTVIERICGTSTSKVAYVAPNGTFSFRLGGMNEDMTDASVGVPDATWNPVEGGFGSTFGAGSGSPTRFNGCEIRAALAGYRSSQVALNVNQTLGNIDIGTIVVYPAVRVPGTTVSATNLTAPKSAKKALAQAEKAIERKKAGDAEKYLKAALSAYPTYAAAWYNLGQIYEQSGRVEDARNAFSKALEADGKYVYPYVGLARLAASESKWQLAADLTAHALELDPIDLPEGYLINCVANFNLGNLDAAEKSARKLERLDSAHRFPQTHLVRAQIFRRAHNSAGEAEQLQEYLKYAPHAANADLVRSRLHELGGSNPG